MLMHKNEKKKINKKKDKEYNNQKKEGKKLFKKTKAIRLKRMKLQKKK